MGKVLAQSPLEELKEPGQDSSPVPDLAQQGGSPFLAAPREASP